MARIVASSYQLFVFLFIVFLNANILIVCISLSPPRSSSCRSEERIALLQFKNHFSVNESSQDCYLETPFWKEDDEDCCGWKGVSCDDMTGHITSLYLDNSCLNGTFPQNSSLFSLVHLQSLSLGDNHFANSRISPWFGNLTKLTYLTLSNSEFSGIVPGEIFQLPKLEELSLSQNYGLRGKLISPNATGKSKLKKLDLSETGLTGELPDSISQFKLLQSLDLSETGFTGELPDSISQFKLLQFLDLSNCNFFGSIPTSLGNMTNLAFLSFENNRLNGEIPSSISNLQSLYALSLENNSLHGSIPPLSNLSQLHYIFMKKNVLSGQLKSQLFNLSTLLSLDVSENELSGTIDLNIFAENNPILNSLMLSKNRLLVSNTNSCILSSFPNIQILYLSSCGITITSMFTYLNASKVLQLLDLSENKIETEIHPSICNLQYLSYLDLSDNWFSGPIPACFGRSSSLQVLKLENNNLHGIIPHSIGYSSKLQAMDLSNNQLQGVIPRSLANCTNFEVLNLGQNMLVDFFPVRLMGNMPLLKVLILRENKFHGSLEMKPGILANLHIIDVSHNDLTGTLPSTLFLNLKSLITNVNESIAGSLYMKNIFINDFYSVSIMNKGQLLKYAKVLVNLKVIDFSQNKFNGEIPLCVGKLEGVQVLNFSGNVLNGRIPPLVNLTNLESLDLSRNKLCGKVPQELAGLSFLAAFNVSHNNLTGLIPQGGQFNTFSSTSYEGNPGLCGPPLQNSCSNHTVKTPAPAPRKSQHFKFELDGFGWEEVLIGYVGGLVVGLFIGCIFVKEEWLKRFFRVKMHQYGRHRS